MTQHTPAPASDLRRDQVGLRVLVMTVVHDPDDARILFRQIASLRAAGAEVTFAAPFSAYQRIPPPGITAIDLPRATGRRRVAAVAAARRVLHRRSRDVDVVLLHDPELLLALPGLGARRSPVVVWDVHEDTAAAIRMKGWLPQIVRPMARMGVRAGERWAERRCELLLAEEGYAGRFRGSHPVVPNSVLVPAESPPPSGVDRVVYLGRLTGPRGALEMISLGRILGPQIRVELIGPADPDVGPAIAEAHRQGWIYHHGFVPNAAALRLLGGALAGLALLHDQPNYHTSRPTKVMEYMALGVPVVTTPNQASADLVQQYDCGTLVPYQDPQAAARAVLALRDDPGTRQRFGDNGRAGAVRDLDWRVDGARFAQLLSEWAAAHPR